MAKEKEVEFKTLDDGSLEEVYRSKAGNIVTPPALRSKGGFPDPRQQVCWDLYVKSWRDGKPSARQAAKDAGYALNTANNVPNLTWFKKKKKKFRQSNMMSNAEKNLSRVLRMEWAKIKLLEDGSEEEVVDKDILKAVIDVSKTIVTTLGKDDGYSTKVIEDKNVSHNIKIESVSYADQIEVPVEAQPLIKEAIIDEIKDEN